MKKNEKTVGILGGMGPFATCKFFNYILDNTLAKKDWEHLHLLIDNNVKISSRTRAILYHERSPVPEMIKSINNLAKIGADFIVVPCNSAHFFYPEVIPKITIPWLNMIEIVSQVVTYKKPLILGGYIVTSKKLYSRYLPGAIYLKETENKFIFEVIEEIKLTSNLAKSKQIKLKDLVKRYQTKIDSVLYACTELSIVFNPENLSGLKVIDSTLEYAKATVKYAKS